MYRFSPSTAVCPFLSCFSSIGPRFVLNPIKVFDGSFGGRTLYENPRYVTPNAVSQCGCHSSSCSHIETPLFREVETMEVRPLFSCFLGLTNPSFNR